MRLATRLLLGAGLFVVTAAFAAAQGPKDIIDRAIRAHAGTEAQLANRKICVSKSRGVMVFPVAGDAAAIRETSAVFPDRIKWVGEFTLAGNKNPFIIALDGLKGWRLFFGAAQDLTPSEYDVAQDDAHFLWLCTLIPLKERSYTLTLLPETKVNDRLAVGVKIESRGRGTVQLYFDTRDNLLVKGVYRSREAGIEVTKENLFSEHKDFGGLKQPTRQSVYLNGKKTEDWTFESYRFPERIDAKEFAKP